MSSALLFAVLAHWLITMYIVEAEIFRPLRELVAGKKTVCRQYLFREDDTVPCDSQEALYRHTEPSRPKLKYLVSCRMCTGFWVGLAIGLVTGLNPLVIAALSHWLFITQRIAERAAK